MVFKSKIRTDSLIINQKLMQYMHWNRYKSLSDDVKAKYLKVEVE